MTNADTLKIVNDALDAVKLMNRKWQGLSDDEVFELSIREFTKYEFARAIEQALKEKNHV